MKRILLVKTSSLGDVIHNLPVVSDILTAHPGAEIHWAVEESFAAIPRLHDGVERVLPVAIRRWRAGWWRPDTRREIADLARALRSEPYDIVIDTQGLLKSALVTWRARGTRCGLDFASARELLALFYDRTFPVPWTLHAVERNRSLAAQALGYAARGAVDYGIRAPAARFPWLPAGRYAVLVHATSAAGKLWAEDNWIVLGARLDSRNVRSVLPWGGGLERARSERLAAAIPNAVVPPPLVLEEAASLLAGAAAVAGVDTGLTHLAGALKVPTAGIYGATDPAATGLYGCARAVNVGGVGAPPSVKDVAGVLERFLRE